jgi:predicted dehydrogenase
MTDVGVIGCGYWGSKLVRVFQSLVDVQVVACCDLNPKRLANLYPHIKTFGDIDTFAAQSACHAVAIATPIDTHYEIAKRFLQAGKHVFVEKPLATSSGEAAELNLLAKDRNRVLGVGHVFLYHPAVDKIRLLIEDEKDFGDMLYFESTRAHLGGFHGGSNVIWDLGPHDVSILLDILRMRGIGIPSHVRAAGASQILDDVANLVYATLVFPGKLIAQLNWNWLSATKIRTTIIGCRRKTIIYDDLSLFEKVKVYEASVNITQQYLGDLSIYRHGDIHTPQISDAEPLYLECADFVHAIKQNRQPYSSAQRAISVVGILERIEKSLTEGGWQ